MLNNTINRFHYLLDTIPGKLRAIPEQDFSALPGNNKWSKKQIIGHLIDSATNNHQRFVRIPYQDNPPIVYQQDDWVKHNYYQQAAQDDVIRLWEIYNRHLLFIIEHIPEKELTRTGITGGDPVTLQWLIEDYVVHMEHHLHTVVAYE